jgi:hypothetical protein
MTHLDTARTEPTKRKRLSSEARRQDFINQAIEFFAEEGFESSTRGLAKKLGVTAFVSLFSIQKRLDLRSLRRRLRQTLAT